MNRVDRHIQEQCASMAQPAPPATCDRRDLTEWSIEGGPLPIRLAAHIRNCSACAAHVRRVNEVHASLNLLQSMSIPPDLPARANGRALRMLKRVARASSAAQRLLRIRPNLTRLQRAGIHLARMSLGAAAAVLTLLMRAGLLTGFEQTKQMGQALALRHWEQHIDPGDGSMGPPPHLM
jgi:hypothetical protein